MNRLVGRASRLPGSWHRCMIWVRAGRGLSKATQCPMLRRTGWERENYPPMICNDGRSFRFRSSMRERSRVFERDGAVVGLSGAIESKFLFLIFVKGNKRLRKLKSMLK